MNQDRQHHRRHAILAIYRYVKNGCFSTNWLAELDLITRRRQLEDIDGVTFGNSERITKVDTNLPRAFMPWHAGYLL
jgi:hypothetical protein